MSNTFQPRFAGYVERVHKSLQEQPFMDVMLNAKATRVEPGLVEISVPVTKSILQPHGNVHGMIASAAADSAAGYAAQTLIPEGYDVVTVEYKINYLAPGIGENIIALGQVTRSGKSISVCTADIFSESAGQRTLFAYLVTTMMAVERG